jgi:hypothetical protein
MPQVGFESTIPVFEQTKTVFALDRAATVIDSAVKYVKDLCEEYLDVWGK